MATFTNHMCMLGVVLGGNIAEGEKIDQIEMGSAEVANPHLDNASSGIATLKEAGHDPVIKARDDEEQVRSLNDVGLMAGSRGLSKRCEQQGKVEFNS